MCGVVQPVSGSPVIFHELPQFTKDNFEKLLRQKECLRHTTRALIPPYDCDLPGGLTRLQEVVALRRHRVGVALTTSVTAHWPRHHRASCVELHAIFVTLQSLLWTQDTCCYLARVRERARSLAETYLSSSESSSRFSRADTCTIPWIAFRFHA